MDTAARRFIEQLGVLLDAEGYPRVAGQLLGMLLLAPDPISLDDLAEGLAISKASVSVNIRFLEQRDVVERVAHPGDRRDYYRIADDLLERSIEHRITKWRRFHEAVHDVRRGSAGHHRAVRARLHVLDDAYSHMIGAMSDALEKWRSAASRPAVRS